MSIYLFICTKFEVFTAMLFFRLGCKNVIRSVNSFHTIVTVHFYDLN
jgi:hypothetical protein